MLVRKLGAIRYSLIFKLELRSYLFELEEVEVRWEAL